LLTTTFIDIPASSHVYLNLDLQLLCRSTFIQLIPTIKDGSLFIQQMSSTNTVAKHEFKSAFIYNDSHIFLQTQGKSWSLKIYQVLLIYNQRKRYLHHKILNYTLTVKDALITCQNVLMSSYLQEHGSSVNTRSSLIPIKAFPFHDIRCRDTRLNTKFNYTNIEINPTIISQESHSIFKIYP
jgi:hypothetical protein